MVAGDPGQGGATWAVLQYVLGLRHLGHEVYLVEPVRAELAGSPCARYFEQLLDRFQLRGHAALLRPDTREACGMSYPELRSAAQRADVLINISGLLADPELAAGIPIRAYLDLDPAFNQLWQAAQGLDMRFGGHTHHVTIGQAIGEPGCPVPTCGLTWIKTLQPVVLEEWPPAAAITRDAFTTIGNWRGYGSIEHGGIQYGQKAHSLRPLFGLPGRTGERFELAMSIHPAETKDLESLKAGGWTLLDPAQVAGTPDQYRAFIQGSRAEFGVAKSGYVASRCGWFSDRSVCYLASGRPVLAQDTGFAASLPTGAGLLAFSTLEEAAEGAARIRADYARHAAMARQIAEEYFASGPVLERLLEKIGA